MQLFALCALDNNPLLTSQNFPEEHHYCVVNFPFLCCEHPCSPSILSPLPHRAEVGREALQALLVPARLQLCPLPFCCHSYNMSWALCLLWSPPSKPSEGGLSEDHLTFPKLSSGVGMFVLWLIQPSAEEKETVIRCTMSGFSFFPGQWVLLDCRWHWIQGTLSELLRVVQFTAFALPQSLWMLFPFFTAGGWL